MSSPASTPDQPPGAPTAPPPIPPQRLAAVEAARQQWIAKLIDPSRRNNLLYFRDLKVGTLDLSQVPAAQMQALLRPDVGDGEGVTLSKLFGEAADHARAAASVKEIARRATVNLEERGLETMFLALGMATWPAPDGGRPASAPVLLVPMRAALKGQRGTTWTLRRSGEPRCNDVLVHALAAEHGVTLAPDDLLGTLLGDEDGETSDLEPLFDRVARLAAAVAGFAIERRWVIGNFSFQKMSIVRDLKDLLEPLARHDIIAGIAGDGAARDSARAGRTTVDPRTFDQVPPDHEFLVLDADSSQQQAIAATLAGHNGVISGPPGTGKSQTIANLIAELSAAGKTVLFVAEKRAALEVVLRRLHHAGLDHLCLDLHGADVSRKQTAQQLARSIDVMRDAIPPDVAALHAAFADRRARVNRHAAGMHTPRLPSGLSVHQIYGRLLRLPETAAARTRFRGPALAPLVPAVVHEAQRLLTEAASMPGLLTGDDPSPWTGAVVSREQVAAMLDLVPGLASDRWPACVRQLDALWREAGVTPPVTLGDARRALDVLCDVHALAQRYRLSLFDADPHALAAALAPASRLMSRLVATLTNGSYRRALAAMRGHTTIGSLDARQALEDARRAAVASDTWQALGMRAALRSVPEAVAARETFRAASDGVAALLSVFPSMTGDALPLARVGEWLDRLAGDRVTPTRLLRMQEIAAALSASGCAGIVAEIRERTPPPAQWPHVLEHAWLSSCLEAAQLAEPVLASFVGRHHDGVVEEFARLDRERLAAAIERVRRAHAERAVAVRDRFRDQNDLVGREAQKRSRHLPLRKLFAEAPDVLLALRPCWMASPLSVSQLLPGDRPYFDVVIFDEASQVLPEDAVTSLLRGARAVIAGDARQLPPTTFFAAGVGDEGDEESGEATGGFESVLDVMSAFLDPPWSLDWHYRSRDEALIAFSNHHIYGNRLVTFPGPGQGAVSWVHVAHVPGEAGRDDSAAREVQRVVDLILDHARHRPDESLGVIAMGITHADRIEMALDRARQAHPDLDEFFSAERDDRFFVKNLERVQGDERDAIILSVGYGKDATGRLSYRFGPLLMQGGERRLNVAITRARRRITLVSSFSHADVRADYPKEGVRLLRAYIEYAASNGTRLDGGTITRVPLNDFEQSVCDALTRRGLHVIPQLGASRYRIDLVVTHPERQGQYLLAVECDGASYHSTPTARERDRLRQQHLEALGWRFHRIWSTDWFLRRDEEITRLMAAYDAAVAAADAPGPVVPTVTVAPRAAAVADEPPTVTRAPRPSIRSGLAIGHYEPRDIEAMVRWVVSDGRLLTHDEIVDEVIDALGFSRRGIRIVSAIERAIASVKAT